MFFFLSSVHLFLFVFMCVRTSYIELIWVWNLFLFFRWFPKCCRLALESTWKNTHRQQYNLSASCHLAIDWYIRIWNAKGIILIIYTYAVFAYVFLLSRGFQCWHYCCCCYGHVECRHNTHTYTIFPTWT